MNTSRAKELALIAMSKHGLNVRGWRFQFNNRKRSAGICDHSKKTVELSLPLTQLSNEVDVMDTILHEIAHALVGSGHGHDAVWQRKAIEIGCNGKRCYGEEKASTFQAYKMVAKYKGVCPNGHEVFKNRMPRKRQSCATCCPRFNEKYLFVYNPQY